MTLDADQIIDRRRLRRKLTFWRVVGFLAVAIIIVAGLVLAAGPDAFPGLREEQIARVTISGFITEDQDQIDLLDKLAKTEAVKGVIVAIDSTGGATSGGEALYEGLLKLSKKKPTVASIGTFGASAAYMAAIATDHVVVRRTSITGSIGVVFQFPEVSQLMKTLGIAVEEVKSSPLKAEPSPFKPASEATKQVMAGIVRDSYNWFVDIVARRRNLPRATALELADGRIYTGRQAIVAKLVDEIGGEETAIAWLATKGVNKNLPIRDWHPINRDRGFLFSFADVAALWLARQTGIAPDLLRGGVIDHVLPQSLKLDGLMSVWQGPLGRDDGPAEGAGR